jgi:hypothetical protein
VAAADSRQTFGGGSKARILEAAAEAALTSVADNLVELKKETLAG